MASYHVAVGAFEGPFDLLLHLIARHKVDVHDIPLAQITDDYLAVLRTMETVDLEVTTEFLVVAATLLELKAAGLLPVDVDDDLDDLALEARDLLYARLLEYRTFKEAAADLRARFDAGVGFVPRLVPLEPPFAALRPPLRLPVDASQLAAIAARALADRPPEHVDLAHVQPVRLSLHEAAAMLVDELARAEGPVPFRELTAGCRHRAEVVVHFLALLELYKHEQVDLDQPASFGTIVVTWTPERGLGRLTDLRPTSDAAEAETVAARDGLEEAP